MNRCPRNCHICQNIIQSSRFHSNQTHVEYPINSRFDCTSDWVIYLVTCKMTGKQYVGKTEQKLSERFHAHLSNIRNGIGTDGMEKHFIEKCGIGSIGIQIIGMYVKIMISLKKCIGSCKINSYRGKTFSFF